MNRNTESHFANTPTISINRSKFDRSFDHKTTFNTGDLIPIFCDGTIMPGDTVKMRMSEVVRMMTPIAPVMDNANLDLYWFFVPYRLIWDHFKAFFGENDTAPWIQNVEYEIPQIVAPENGWTKGSLADYMGYPTKVGGYKASALPFRAYALIWNEWFRDQNFKNPCYITQGDSDITGVDITNNNYDYVTDTEKAAAPCKAAKYFDYFTSCLPSAQKGPAVTVPLGTYAPVVLGENNAGSQYTNTQLLGDNINISGGSGTTVSVMYPFNGTTNDYDKLSSTLGNQLFTDLSDAVGATVNQLRQAFQIQKFYERQAIGGTRYIEMVKSHFEVTNPDFRMQRPEYLGGKRIPINMNQVVQTDATKEYSISDDTLQTWETKDGTPQGNTAAYSVTSDVDNDMFTHTFTEHGILMGLAVVRTIHTYQQGLNRQWSKKKFTDFYFPEFANLGNMAVLNKEIFLQGTDTDEEAFGYQEAWASERYFPNRVSGEMRSNYDQPLDIWHYADDYASLPSLSSEWIDETKDNVARTLAVQNHDQFFGDFYFGAIYTRPMPLYSVPGLIDHH